MKGKNLKKKDISVYMLFYFFFPPLSYVIFLAVLYYFPVTVCNLGVVCLGSMEYFDVFPLCWLF